jgi:predicted membrane-bound mannosyltransferase
VLPFYAGLVLMAGIGAAAVVRAARHRAARVLLARARRRRRGSSPRRASARASATRPTSGTLRLRHTSPDYLRLVARVRDLAALHPRRTDMLVEVVAGPYEQWPFPWYARGLGRVGYWSRAADAGPLDGTPP